MRQQSKTREPAVAGAFYPRDPEKLRTMINDYLQQVPRQNVEGTVRALIAPHAGYIYSGPVAAHAYKLIQGKDYDAVVVLAISHRYPFNGASIYDGDMYQTPLGSIPLHTELISRMREASPRIHYEPLAHTQEHSLEVHLPFLQVVLENDFELIPVILGDARYETAQDVAGAIASIAKDKNILVVASTDLSHFHPYAEARDLDTETVEQILNLKPEELARFFEKNPERACGRCPVVTAALYADMIGASERKILTYANSGDTAGDKSQVVGYVSAVFSEEVEQGSHSRPSGEQSENTFSEKTKQELFSLVRNTIRQKLKDGTVSFVQSDNPELQTENGAFVTLHTQEGALRGCIGNFVSNQPLYKTIQEMALAAAFRDPRFPPVSLEELGDLRAEISVLSPMEKIDDVSAIELGKHGIYIKKGFRSGTFLPQVATETGWDLEEFLGHCAQDKAGIGWDGWKDAEVYVYTADVFGEDR